MRTKINTRALALAGKSRKTSRKSFASGLLFGLSAASLFLAGELPKPKAPKEGIGADWDAIGRDLRAAMDRHGS
jgi:hypothetical protein